MVFLMANLCCSGCSPGKSPFGALTRFPLQSGWPKISLWQCTNDGSMPTKFQPNQPRDHGSRTSPCTGNGSKTPG